MAVSQAEFDRVKALNGKLRRDKREAEEDAVSSAEEARNGRTNNVKRGAKRFLSDSLTDVGSVTAGFLGAVDLPVGGEKIAMGVGFVGRLARPFVEPLGVFDQVLSVPNGLWIGGEAVSTYKWRVRRKAEANGNGNGNGA